MTQIRPDLSSKLIHLVKANPPKPDTMESAFNNFWEILDGRHLKGGNGMILGGHSCVCFTETPLPQLVLSLAQRKFNRFKYRPLGFMFDKNWAFARGARPAIYQPKDEYDLLPTSIQYRHVTYDPSDNTDFTWEREWRMATIKLDFSPEDVTLLVPNRHWFNVLLDRHVDEVREKVGTEGASAVVRYPWHVVALSDLGIDVPDGLA